MYTTHMKANNTGRTYEERVREASKNLYKKNVKREEERKANPTNWNEVIKDYYKK